MYRSNYKEYILIQDIDNEISKLTNECYDKAVALVKAHKTEIKKLSDEVLKKESVDLPVILDILGKRKFANEEAVKDYLSICNIHLKEKANEKVNEKADEKANEKANKKKS